MIDKVKQFCSSYSFKPNAPLQLPIEFSSKEFFKCFLTVLCEDKSIDYLKELRIIEALRKDIITLGLKYTETIDEWAIANVVLYQRMTCGSIINNDLMHFIKFVLFVCVISKNLNQTNQIISNMITILNNVIDYVFSNDNDNNGDESDEGQRILIKYVLIDLNIKLTLAVKAFNPSLLNQITMLVQLINNSKEELNEINDYSQYGCFFTKSNDSIEKALKHSICNHITTLLNHFKDDINIDILFSKLIQQLSSIKKGNKALIDPIMILYKDYSFKAKQKKRLRMNYLIIKPKPIASLEPDYDLSFLGDHPDFINQKAKKKEIDKAMKKKVKEKEKQIVRKFKQEAKIIDTERQSELKYIDKKRKEDMRMTNQFIEQQNLEYKKLMTSNDKKRHKFKKKRGGK